MLIGKVFVCIVVCIEYVIWLVGVVWLFCVCVEYFGVGIGVFLFVWGEENLYCMICDNGFCVSFVINRFELWVGLYDWE